MNSEIPHIVDPAKAGKYVGLSVQYLAKLRCYGCDPAFLKLGRRVRYRKADIDSWLNEQIRTSTSQEVA